MSQNYARIHSTTFIVELQHEISSKPFRRFGPVVTRHRSVSVYCAKDNRNGYFRTICTCLDWQVYTWSAFSHRSHVPMSDSRQ